MPTGETQDRLPIIITGHVDHGKSTLIGRLLHETGKLSADRYKEIQGASTELGLDIEFAFAMDTLEEERAQAMTFDVSYFDFATRQRNYCIIDCPGHKELIKNMVTGASHANAAVLVVDVLEGTRDQTNRHLSVLQLLGIRNICVVISKMDLVEYGEAAFLNAKKEVDALFGHFSIEPTAVIPISALHGTNIAATAPGERTPWYSGPSLTEALDGLQFLDRQQNPLRFAVQDHYQMDKENIIVGQIESGEVRTGMKVEILPQRTASRVREIRKFGCDQVAQASFGESIGLVLDGNVAIDRGNVLTAPKSARAVSEVMVNLFCFTDQLDQGERVVLRCSTQEVPCRLTFLAKNDAADADVWITDPPQLQSGEIAKVRLELERPVVVDSFSVIPEFGRFVIEKNGAVVAGGVVV